MDANGIPAGKASPATTTKDRLGLEGFFTTVFDRLRLYERHRGRRGLHRKNISLSVFTMKDMKSMKAYCEIFMSFMLFMVKNDRRTAKRTTASRRLAFHLRLFAFICG
jgi:hypothetical protein